MKYPERIANLPLEEAVEELIEKIGPMSREEKKLAKYYYHGYLNDRHAFRIMNVSEHYAGEKNGEFHPLAKARLLLLAYYTSKE